MKYYEDGLVYDTDESTPIAVGDRPAGILYLTSGGRFFLARSGSQFHRNTQSYVKNLSRSLTVEEAANFWEAESKLVPIFDDAFPGFHPDPA